MTQFYLIGIGGAGMSVVAQLLMAAGHCVAGSDREDSENVQTLREAGAQVWIGHHAEQVPADAVIVVSSAIKDSNPELAIARRRGQQIIHRSQALAFASAGRAFVAVAGAHGKTSTSSMLAMALAWLGEDPSWAIGGTIQGGIPGGYLGNGDVLVAEADESDASFLNYSPCVEIVTNVEPDHLDHYGTREAFEQAFVDFAHCMVPGGLLIACSDDSGSLALARQAHANGLRVCTYGFSDTGIASAGSSDIDKTRHSQTSSSYRGGACITHDQGLHAQIRLVTPSRPGALVSGEIEFRGKCYELNLSVPGRHMLLNAAGAWLAGVELGQDPQEMAEALREFRGASRRFELVGEVKGVRVIDDYAHHPTEIRATLSTARELCGGGAVRVLYQPHLYSRTKNFAREFAEALSLADSVIVTSVYAAREVPSDGVDGNAIAELMENVPFIADMHEAALSLAHQSHTGDILITMGAGSVTAMAPVITDEVRQR